MQTLHRKHKKWMGYITYTALLQSSETIAWMVMARTVRRHPINFIADSPPQEPVLRSARNADGAPGMVTNYKCHFNSLNITFLV